LPPATLASPGTGTSTTCSLDSLVVGLEPLPTRGSTSGRRPAYTATTSARVSEWASTRFAAARMYSMSSSVATGSARCGFDAISMGAATDRYQARLGISREDQDAVAAESHARAAAAIKEGRLPGRSSRSPSLAARAR
jgi:Thiolase, N-terminal domain